MFFKYLILAHYAHLLAHFQTMYKVNIFVRNTVANGMCLHGKIEVEGVASWRRRPEAYWHPSKILDRQHILSIDSSSSTWLVTIYRLIG